MSKHKQEIEECEAVDLEKFANQQLSIVVELEDGTQRTVTSGILAASDVDEDDVWFCGLDEEGEAYQINLFTCGDEIQVNVNRIIDPEPGMDTDPVEVVRWSSAPAPHMQAAQAGHSPLSAQEHSL